MHDIRVDKALASYTSHMAVYEAMQAWDGKFNLYIWWKAHPIMLSFEYWLFTLLFESSSPNPG